MQALPITTLLDDAALARAIAAAAPQIDTQAESELYRRFAPRVRLYGLRHLRDPHAANDLMQQILMMTIESLRAGKLREADMIASYVLGMCRMVVLEIRRGTFRRDGLLQLYGDATEAADVVEPRGLDVAQLSRCMPQLSVRERSVLVLSFFADKPADEVAAELGLEPGNTRVIRHRALLKLRECMSTKKGSA